MEQENNKLKETINVEDCFSCPFYKSMPAPKNPIFEEVIEYCVLSPYADIKDGNTCKLVKSDILVIKKK